MRPEKTAKSVKRARQFRRTLSKPEFLLWQILRTSPNGHKFRKQHPAGPFVLDFFCAKANLAIEIDSYAHDTGQRPERDAARDGSSNTRSTRCAYRQLTFFEMQWRQQTQS